MLIEGSILRLKTDSVQLLQAAITKIWQAPSTENNEPHHVIVCQEANWELANIGFATASKEQSRLKAYKYSLDTKIDRTAETTAR
jgi:hypothetical protein